MSDSILSQAEIDRLLNGGNNSEIEHAADQRLSEDAIKPYDPNTQRRVVRERLHSLEIINERFARQFRMGLFNLLRRSWTLPPAISKFSLTMSLRAICRCRPTSIWCI